jgi:AAA domain/TOTE conflict system, Archaeo-Eukaryotic Primase domain/Primase C terminal 2 (PriCT-2)
MTFRMGEGYDPHVFKNPKPPIKVNMSVDPDEAKVQQWKERQEQKEQQRELRRRGKAMPDTVKLEFLKEVARHCWRGAHWEKPKGEHPSCVHEPLKISHLQRHLDGGAGVGLAPITPGTNTTRCAVLDLDDHGGKLGWEDMIAHARKIKTSLDGRDLRPLLFRSSGGKGIHIYLLWQEQQDAYSVRQMLNEVLADADLKSGTKGVDHSEVEIFPKQDSVPADGFGNMFVLPYAGHSTALDLHLDPTTNVPTIKHSDAVITRARPVVEHTTATVSVDLQELSNALDAIPNEGEGASYDEWRNIVFAIHSATGGSSEGLGLAEKFSARSSKCDLEFLRNRVWPYIRDREGGITAATIFNLARQHDDPASYFTDISGTTAEPAPAPTLTTVTEPAPQRFLPIRDDQYVKDKPPLSWLVKRVLPKAELVFIYGPSTFGKTFIALDIAQAVARGEPWRGEHKTNAGRVIFVAAEDPHGVGHRLQALQQHHSVHYTGIEVIDGVPTLGDIKECKALAAAIDKCDLLIFDTLSEVSVGLDENSAKDMKALHRNCKWLAKRLGCTVAMIHHAGKDGSKGMRGSTVLAAHADVVLEVRLTNGQRQVYVEKIKNARAGAIYPFTLREVSIGIDEDQEPIVSAVVEHIPQADVAVTGPEALLKGEVEKAVYRAWCDLVPLEGGTPDKFEVVRAAAATLMPPEEGKRDTRVQHAKRAMERLVERGLLANGGMHNPLPDSAQANNLAGLV